MKTNTNMRTKTNRTPEVQEIINRANAQILHLLPLLGFQTYPSQRWLSCACQVHGGDNRHGFAWNIEKGFWKCFTNECQAQYGSDIIGLVKGVKRCSDAEAIDWLVENIPEGVSPLLKLNVQKEDPIYTEKTLLRLFKTDFYCKRGFASETVDAFEHGKAESGKMYNRIVFPIRDEAGMIRGFSGRWAGKEGVIDNKQVCLSASGKPVPKWKHLISKSQYLYNFYRAQKICQDELIVVESIGNVMRFWECGMQNCVASLGKDLSAKQISLIIKSTKKLILAFDSDKAGSKGTQKAIKMLEPYINLKIIITPTNKDWAALSNQEVLDICKQSMLVPQD